MSKVVKAFFYGSCDITAITSYIRNKNCCFNDYKRFGNFLSFQSTYWVESIFNREVVHPFVENGVYPDCSIFTKEEKILVFTVLCEPLFGEYKDSQERIIRFGYPHLDATEDYDKKYPYEYKKYGRAVFDSFANNFVFEGMIKVDKIVDNFRTIMNHFPKGTQFVIILGPTIDSDFGEMNKLCQTIDMKKTYQKINDAMVTCFKSSNVHFINPNNFYKEPKRKEDLFYYNFPSMIHYTRGTYKRMAKAIHHLFPSIIKYDYLNELKRLYRKIIRPKLSLLKVFIFRFKRKQR